MSLARRFWREVTIAGRGIRLDDRPLRTPAGAPLLLPSDALAEAIAREWRSVADAIDPGAMPLTGLANAAIDRVSPDREGFARGIAAYADSDLLCYRADAPDSLVARQAAAWDGPLRWAERRYDVGFVVTPGIVHVPQPPATLTRMAAAVAAYDAFGLAALHPLTTLSGSLVLALAVAEGEVEPDAAWRAAELDELWQAERWGEDTLAMAARAARAKAFGAAARMLAIL